MVTRTAIHIEEQRILLALIEVGRLDDVIVQLNALVGLQRAELFFLSAVISQSLLQCRIVLQHFDYASLGVVQRIARRVVGAAVGADIVFATIAEGCVVGTQNVFAVSNAVGAIAVVELIRSVIVEAHFLLSLKINDIQVRIDSSALVAAIIDLLILLIDAAHIDNVIAACSYLPYQLAVKTIKIDVVESVLLAGNDERLAVVKELPRVGHIDVCGAFLGVERTNLACRGIGRQQFHLVLQAVHPHKSQHIGVLGPLHPWQILVVLTARVEALRTLVGQVVNINVHHRIVLACLGVLVIVVVGIEAAPGLHSKLTHLALVKAVVGYTTAVRTPVETLRDGKLLLVYPIGRAVDDSVHTSVGSNLMLGLRIQVHIEQVIVAHISHLRPVGRKRGQALLAFVRNLVERAGCNVIDIIVRNTAVAVDGLEPAAEQDFLLVGREFIAFNRRQRLGLQALGLAAKSAHRALALTGLIRELLDSGACKHTIVLAVLHRTDALDAARCKGAVGPDVFKSYLFCRLCHGNIHSSKQ